MKMKNSVLDKEQHKGLLITVRYGYFFMLDKFLIFT